MIALIFFKIITPSNIKLAVIFVLLRWYPPPPLSFAPPQCKKKKCGPSMGSRGLGQGGGLLTRAIKLCGCYYFLWLLQLIRLKKGSFLRVPLRLSFSLCLVTISFCSLEDILDKVSRWLLLARTLQRLYQSRSLNLKFLQNQNLNLKQKRRPRKIHQLTTTATMKGV